MIQTTAEKLVDTFYLWNVHDECILSRESGSDHKRNSSYDFIYNNEKSKFFLSVSLNVISHTKPQKL